MTNGAARRWVEAHTKREPESLDAVDAVEAEARLAVETDPGWWGRES